MSNEKPPDFDEEMKLFDFFWTRYLKDQWPYHLEDEETKKKFKADSKLTIYLFVRWLNWQGLGIYSPEQGCLAYDLVVENVKLEKSREKLRLKRKEDLEIEEMITKREAARADKAILELTEKTRELKELKKSIK